MWTNVIDNLLIGMVALVFLAMGGLFLLGLKVVIQDILKDYGWEGIFTVIGGTIVFVIVVYALGAISSFIFGIGF